MIVFGFEVFLFICSTKLNYSRTGPTRVHLQLGQVSIPLLLQFLHAINRLPRLQCLPQRLNLLGHDPNLCLKLANPLIFAVDKLLHHHLAIDSMLAVGVDLTVQLHNLTLVLIKLILHQSVLLLSDANLVIWRELPFLTQLGLELDHVGLKLLDARCHQNFKLLLVNERFILADMYFVKNMLELFW